jgi:hypothetical protein
MERYALKFSMLTWSDKDYLQYALKFSMLTWSDKDYLQWELFDQGGLMLSNSDEIAGKGVMFLYVDDLAAERSRGWRAKGSRSGTTFQATIRRLRSCAIPTATSSRWRRRPPKPSCRHDRAGRAKSEAWRPTMAFSGAQTARVH